MNKKPNTENEIINALMNDAALMLSNGKGGLYRVRVTRDQEPLDPRVDMENLGVMYCSHRRYSLGDEKLDEDTKQKMRNSLLSFYKIAVREEIGKESENSEKKRNTIFIK